MNYEISTDDLLKQAHCVTDFKPELMSIETIDENSQIYRHGVRSIAQGTLWDALSSDSNQPIGCDDVMLHKYYVYSLTVEAWKDLWFSEVVELINDKNNEIVDRRIKDLITKYGLNEPLGERVLDAMVDISGVYQPIQAFIYNFLRISEYAEKKTGIHNTMATLVFLKQKV